MVPGCNLTNDGGCGVVGIIIQHDDFQLNILAGQGGLNRLGDCKSFIPSRYENRNSRPC